MIKNPDLVVVLGKAGLENQLIIINYDYGRKDWFKHLEKIQNFTIIMSGFSIHHQTDVRKQEIYTEKFELIEPGGCL